MSGLPVRFAFMKHFVFYDNIKMDIDRKDIGIETTRLTLTLRPSNTQEQRDKDSWFTRHHQSPPQRLRLHFG